MSSQVTELKLNGRFFDTLYKRGSIAIGTSIGAAFAFYLFVYRRRKIQFEESERLSKTPEEIQKISQRLAKFGLAPGPGISIDVQEAFDRLKADKNARSSPRLRTFEAEICSLPQEKQELARSLRNDYFAKNLPVNSSVATQLKEKMEGLNDADKFELMKSPAGKSALSAAMKEMSNVDRAELNTGLANLLREKVGLEIQ